MAKASGKKSAKKKPSPAKKKAAKGKKSAGKKKAGRKATKKKTKASATVMAAAVAMLTPMSLREYTIHPNWYGIVSLPFNQTISATLDLRGDDQHDEFVIQMGPPNSANWSLGGNTTIVIPVHTVGNIPVSWPIQLRLTGNRIPGERFEVICDGFLRSEQVSCIRSILFEVV